MSLIRLENRPNVFGTRGKSFEAVNFFEVVFFAKEPE